MKKTLRTAEILALIMAGIYTVIAAIFYSLLSPIYWLFVFLALASCFGGIALGTFVYRFPLDTKKSRIQYIISVVFAGFSLFSLPFSIFVYLKRDQAPSLKPEIKEDEVKKPNKKWYKRASFIVCCVSLGLAFASSFVASIGESSAYSVSINDYRLTKEMTDAYNTKKFIPQDNVSYAFTYYQPKFASPTSKVATIFVLPGFTRTKATMSQYAIEFSKRGAAVFVIDPGSQGATTNSGYGADGEQLSYAAEANGMNYLVDYVYHNTDAFPMLDRTRFGVIGHSAGGGNAVTVASEFAGSNYNESVIKALYISGYIKTGAANKYASLHCNAVNAYAYYDEGAFRYQTDTTALEVINSRFINEVNGNKLNRTVAYDTPFGSMEDGTYRLLHREPTNHCFEMYDSLSITNSIAFFREALHLDTSLADSSHTWMIKEGFNGVALVSLFAFLFAAIAVLVELPVLRKIKSKPLYQSATGEYVYEEQLEIKRDEEKRPTSIPSRFSFKGKTIFWATTIVSFVIACLDYIPLAHLSMHMFPDAANDVFTNVFPARMFNAVLLWATVNGLIGLVLFFSVILIENLVEKIVAKKQGREPVYDWSKLRPLKINPVQLLLTIGLAGVLFFAFYGVIALTMAIFHQDARFMLISAAPLSGRFLKTWIEYIPFIFLFYLGNSIKVNCSIGMEGWKEWKVYLIGALANSLALVFILIINYASFFITGSVHYGYYGSDKREVWLYINMVFALIPMMAFLPIGNRFIYKRVNQPYFGALLLCMIFVFMSLAATISYMI